MTIRKYYARISKSRKDGSCDLSQETLWFTVIGLSDEISMGQLASLSGLNPLVMEDIVNTESRPKVEEYEDHIFVILKMLYLNGSDQIVKEHMALVLKEGRVFLYQEIEDDVFDGFGGGSINILEESGAGERITCFLP